MSRASNFVVNFIEREILTVAVCVTLKANQSVPCKKDLCAIHHYLQFTRVFVLRHAPENRRAETRKQLAIRGVFRPSAGALSPKPNRSLKPYKRYKATVLLLKQTEIVLFPTDVTDILCFQKMTLRLNFILIILNSFKINQ